MKIIFLDIDGVLNHRGTEKKYNPIRANGERLEGIVGVDPVHVAILNDIIEKTGAKVVLSSTWRIVFGVPGTLHTMKQSGFKHDIHDVTPDGMMDPDIMPHRKFKAEVPRGLEIQAWLDRWDKAHPEDPVTNFVILDDNDDMAHLKEKLVLTEWMSRETDGGLREVHVDAILKHLGA